MALLGSWGSVLKTFHMCIKLGLKMSHSNDLSCKHAIFVKTVFNIIVIRMSRVPQNLNCIDTLHRRNIKIYLKATQGDKSLKCRF